jgi:hypothetical protein
MDTQRLETLGPAERIINTLLTHSDHLVHNRPGMVSPDARTNTGVRWVPVTYRVQGTDKVVFRKDKTGTSTTEVRVGVLDPDGVTVRNHGTSVGMYRSPGLFEEVAVWMYRQVADVFKMDNEFVARWASWSFKQEHRDLKTILAAFLLVQDRKGTPLVENGEVLCHDEDYRDVGEAMCLIRGKDDLNPKMLLRVGQILRLPGIADLNRSLGFGRTQHAVMGRYPKVVERWLRHREDNPRMLEGLVRAGFKSTIKDLCRMVGYKPSSPRFFSILGWKQTQAADGRRSMLDIMMAPVETWEGLSEQDICEKILSARLNYKAIVGKLPSNVGLTPAIMAAAIESGSLSDKDLIILTPTLEELGLLNVPSHASRHEKALKEATDQRAANIARNVSSASVKAQLEDASDAVLAKALEETTKNLRIYCMVDRSGSMEGALEKAKGYLKKILVGFPLDRLHVSVFESMGKVIQIQSPKAAAVDQAFRGVSAGGGTSYSAGIHALAMFPPRADEDVLMLWVGDQEGEHGTRLAETVRNTGFSPVAFGMLEVKSTMWTHMGYQTTVVDAAKDLGIPCFNLDTEMFNDDPYAVTRTLRNLIAATPASQVKVTSKRVSLVETILGTPLLNLPLWVNKAA